MLQKARDAIRYFDHCFGFSVALAIGMMYSRTDSSVADGPVGQSPAPDNNVVLNGIPLRVGKSNYTQSYDAVSSKRVFRASIAAGWTREPLSSRRTTFLVRNMVMAAGRSFSASSFNSACQG